MLLPPSYTEDIDKVKLFTLDPLMERNYYGLNLCIPQKKARMCHLVTYYNVWELNRPDIVVIRIKNLKNTNLDGKILLKYDHSDNMGEHYIFDSCEGQIDPRSFYEEWTVRISDTAHSLILGGHKRRVFISIKGNFEWYDVYNNHFGLIMRYNETIIRKFPSMPRLISEDMLLDIR